MSDIFMSYAHADRATAQRLAEALQARGWSVWWDRRVPAGQTFDRVIENALTEAKCVIVLWSSAAVASDWVKTEASEAKARDILLPVLIEDVIPPLEFRRVQAGRLVDWHDTTPHPGFDQLIEDVSRILGRTPSATPSPRQPRYAAFGLVALPTVIAILLAVVLASWPLPTHVRLDVTANRAQFTVAASDTPFIRIFDGVPLQAITAEQFAAVSLEPKKVEAADPVQYNLAEDRYPESAWKAVPLSASVQFRALDEARLPSITLEPAGGGARVLGSLRPMNAPPRSDVTLELAGDRSETVTVRLAWSDPIVRLPIAGRFHLTANHSRISWMLEDPYPGRRPLTYRVEPREGGLPLEIRGTTSLVISLRLPQWSAEGAVTLFSGGTIPIERIDFTRQDELGNRVSAVVAPGQLSYPENSGLVLVSFEAADVIGLDRLDRFRIGTISLDPARKGMRLELEGIAGHVMTRRGDFSRDHRLTAFGVVKRNLSWLGLGLVAWIVPTAIGAYRLFKKRTGG